jgi:heme-binding NEAT domain protein
MCISITIHFMHNSGERDPACETSTSTTHAGTLAPEPTTPAGTQAPKPTTPAGTQAPKPTTPAVTQAPEPTKRPQTETTQFPFVSQFCSSGLISNYFLQKYLKDIFPL